jgi:hypothetical protein
MSCVSKVLKAALAATALFPVAVSAAPPSKAKASSRSTAGPAAGSPMPSFVPAPDWVEDVAIPAADPDHLKDPFQFLLLASQEKLTQSGVENFVQYAVVMQNQAAVQAFGTVTIPWDVERTEMALHDVKILRGDEVIDALKPDDVSVIRRETKLEQSTLNGVRTIVLPLRDLRVGDKLKVAFSVLAKPGIGKTEEVMDMTVKTPVVRVVRRFLVDDDLPVRWAVDPSLGASKDSKLAGATERRFEALKVSPPKEIPYVPGRFSHKLIQVSSFPDWNAVAEPLVPLFTAARQIPDSSPLIKLADKIAAAHKDPAQQMLAVLRSAQDDVRYVALVLGEGNYKPMTADEVWKQRYGDCKGKTAFILALLDRLHIAAEPMLASVSLDDTLGNRLPTLAMFDHVFVRAHVGGETYYLDGTNVGQRTIEELRISPTRYGLPLVAAAQLVKTGDPMPSAPLFETTLAWDASKGLSGKTPFKATLVMRGNAAAEMRAKAMSSTDQDELLEAIKNHVTGVANDALEMESSNPEMPDGSYAVTFKGAAQLDWSPVDGLKGNRYQFSNSTLTWDAGFKRDEEGAKTIPVKMAFPYWERLTETIVLPDNGKAFFLDAKPVDQTVAVTRMTRTVAMNGGVVTSVSDFRRLESELPAEAARAAAKPLETISQDFAYVVSKKKLRLAD